MKKKLRLKLAVCLFFALLSGIAFSASTSGTSPSPFWRVLKQGTGAEITSAAVYDGGLTSYFGDSSGDIYSVNRSGVKSYPNINYNGTGALSVDSIADTAGEYGLGRFTVIAGGKVCTLKNSDTLRSCDEASMYATSYTVLKPQPATDAKAEQLYYDRDSDVLYCICAPENNSGSVSLYYFRYDGQWKEVTNSKVVPAPDGSSGSETVITNEKDKIIAKIENDTSIYSKNSEKINLQFPHFNYSCSIVPDTVYNEHGKFSWTSDGEIKGCFTPLSEELRVNVKYIAPAKDPGKSIYLIKIHGKGISEENLFPDNADSGLNSISYTISSDDTSQKDKTEYPLLGYRYIADGSGQTAAVNPRDISFYWKGPNSDGTRKVTVEEDAYSPDGKEKKETNLYPKGCEVELPKPVNFSPAQGITISITPYTQPGIICCPNGVCLIPFEVDIEDTATQKTIAYDKGDPDSLYNHLLFYSDDPFSQGESYPIACNPYDGNCNYLSVIQRSEAEIDGMVKYGQIQDTYNSQLVHGKVFYLIAGPETKCGANDNAKLWAVLRDNPSANDEQVVSGNLALSKLETDIVTPGEPEGGKDPNTDSDNGRTFTLHGTTLDNPAVSTELKVSSWEGDSDGVYTGYLDYVVHGNGADPGDGVYALFPQGMNTLALEDRLNPSKMQVGYYFEPQNDLTGLQADQYGINDKPEYCKDLKGKTQYAYLFDQYGRYATYTSGPNDYPMGLYAMWNTSTIDEGAGTRIRLTNWSNVPVCMHSAQDQSEVDNCQLGVSANDKGVFVPPGHNSVDLSCSNPGYDFVTGYDVCVENSDPRHWYIYGDSICKVDKYDSTASDQNYDYFKASMVYYDPINKIMGLRYQTSTDVPEWIKDEGINGNDRNFYLPLNQVDIWSPNSRHVRLEYWGVHFVEWDRSCNCGMTPRIYVGMGNDDAQWTYSQGGGFITKGESDTITSTEVPSVFPCTLPNPIYDNSIHGNPGGDLKKVNRLQIDAQVPGFWT